VVTFDFAAAWEEGITREVGMDRNRLLLIGGAIALVLFLAHILGPGGGAIPR
jgi:preprotein translocase subunit Sec61beta